MSDRDMERVQLFVQPSIAEAIDQVADRFSLSRSKILRDLVGQQIEDNEQLSDAVEDAISDDLLDLAQKERKDEQLRDRQKLVEKKASYEDRVRGYFRKRLEGDRAYSPDMMEGLAEGYREDARIWFDEDEDIQQREQYVDEMMDSYRAGYWARSHAEEIDTELSAEETGAWMDVGEDLYRLRSRLEEVVDHVRNVADREGVGWDSDAVIESVARRWSVSEGAVVLLLELLVADPDGSISEMLRLGGETMEAPEASRQLTNGDSDDISIEDLPEDPNFVSRDADARSAVETDGGDR